MCFEENLTKSGARSGHFSEPVDISKVDPFEAYVALMDRRTDKFHLRRNSAK